MAGVGGDPEIQLAGADGLAACRADRPWVELLAAAVPEHDRLGPGHALLVAPLLKREDDRAQLLSGLGEVVFVALGTLRVQPSLDQPECFEPAKTSGEDVAGGAGESRQLLEAPVAVADLPHDQQRVAISDDVKSIGDGAHPL